MKTIRSIKIIITSPIFTNKRFDDIIFYAFNSIVKEKEESFIELKVMLKG